MKTSDIDLLADPMLAILPESGPSANVRFPPIADVQSDSDTATMKRLVVLGASLLAACSAENHSFVVDAVKADKPVAKAVVTICKEPPKPLERSGKWFVGRVLVGCEGAGKVQLTHTDGTTTDCPIGYLTNFDDWWIMEVRGRSCTVEWKSEH